MKSVLISIQPKWCELIASRKKTIEVRKTRPKIETPFRCYIYETKVVNKNKLIVDLDGDFPTKYAKGSGKVIGEFVCDTIVTDKTFGHDPLFIGAACMTQVEAAAYCTQKTYGWHISELKIYDEPKELREFKKTHRNCWYADLGLKKRDCHECRNEECMVSRPPQSWCYVDE